MNKVARKNKTSGEQKKNSIHIKVTITDEAK